MKSAYDEAILITPREAQLICDFIREQLIPVVVDDVSTGTVENDVEFEWIGQMILLYDRLGKRLDKAAERAVGDAGPYKGEGGNGEEADHGD